MSKKIKIGIKDYDKNEFMINEPAERGDYFNLNDIENVSYEYAMEKGKKRATEESEELVKKIFEENKERILKESEE